MREGRTKKTGKLLIALSLRAEARGLSLQPCQDPATQARTQGLGKQPLLPSKKDTRGSHKKDRGTPDRPLALCGGSGALPATSFQTKRMHEGHTKKTGKLLITLSLHAEAWGLFLQLGRDPATQARTRELGKQPVLLNKKDARGSHKKDRKTPDRPLALC